MATPVSVDTHSRGDGSVVLSVSGELDMSNVEVFATAIAEAMTPASQDGGVLTIDLSGVDYLDSAAIDALFGHAGRIRLIVNPILIPVLKISGLTDVTSVEPG
ncbi:STAS domain-containing protein [Mycobacterium sp. 2YAF39]|uniref:STAS domain-containing protein n=1 Tax=Mycobacterium sp. 2YAF39 TaxID=3233033 RepID=UPI003F94D7DA